MTLKEKSLRARLRAAKEDLRVRRKAFNSAQRSLQKTLTEIVYLETLLERIQLANTQ